MKCPFSSHEPLSPFVCTQPGNLPGAPATQTREKLGESDWECLLQPTWVQDRLLNEALSNSNSSVLGGVAKQAPSFTSSFQEGPIQWMDGLSLRFVSFWLFMVTWYMTCWFLGSIIITFFPNTCYFPSLAAIISPLDYCNHLSDFCALSFAPWTTTPNPFSTMYPKWPFQNTKSIMSFLCLKSLR